MKLHTFTTVITLILTAIFVAGIYCQRACEAASAPHPPTAIYSMN